MDNLQLPIFNTQHNLLENLATAALESRSGACEITGCDRNAECSICKRDWETLSNDPMQMKWQSML